jgi:hypothetical protein
MQKLAVFGETGIIGRGITEIAGSGAGICAVIPED